MTTTMQSPAYQRLAALTQQFGGQILVVDEPWEGEMWKTFPPGLNRRGWSTAPFCSNIGIYWAKKIIVHKKVGFTTAGLIHEMGHVFASKLHPNHRMAEEAEFLGWEVVLATQMGIRRQWMREMEAYNVNLKSEDDDDDEMNDGQYTQYALGELTRAERKKVFTKAIALAQKLGSLGPDREIRSIRN